MSKPAVPPPGFDADIRPLFTQMDIDGMAWDFDLSAYADVKAKAANILNRIQGIGGRVMPPPPPEGDGPWDAARIDLFRRWVTGGCQP